MGNSSAVLNSYRAKLNKEGKRLLDECVITSNAMNLSDEELTNTIQKRIHELLKTNALPAIRLIKFSDMVQLGTFPRCPNNVDVTCELDSIDRNSSFLVFISHCWMRGYSGAEGWDGRPHPDDAFGNKFKLCVRGIELLRKASAPRMKECYVWLDFGCINQDGNPAGELEQLDKIVQCCDCIFTPIVDRDHDKWTFPSSVMNWFSDYKAKLWNDGPHAYLNRGWCRVEMLYAANIPVQENDDTSDVKRHTLFEAGLAYHCSQNRRPHFLYGTKEYEQDSLVPFLLPPLQHSYFSEFHPLKGNLSVASDIQHIEQLIAELQPYMDANSISTGYKGDLNNAGERHGYGVMIYEDGSRYEGEWKNDIRSGSGTHQHASGAKYNGNWENGKYHGWGVFTYASGAEYCGQWVESNMCGQGKFCYANGNVYEGEWKDDNRHGFGRMEYASGERYEGEFRDDLKDGPGIHCSSDGNREKQVWVKGEQVGRSGRCVCTVS